MSMIPLKNAPRLSRRDPTNPTARLFRIARAVCLGVLPSLWFAVCAEASINDSGFIMMEGGPAVPAHVGSSSPRFIWNPDKRTFQAGNFNLSSASSGTYSFAFGHEARPWALHSMAFGEFVTIGDEAHYSLAFGHNVKVLGAGQARVAIGKHVTVRHLASIGIGYHAYTEGIGSISLGFRNNAYGYGSVSIGVLNDVDTDTATRGAYAIGHGLNVGREDAFVIGRFNEKGASSSDDYVFVIGNGTDDDTGRSDAFRVSGSGVAWALGGISVGGTAVVNTAGQWTGASVAKNKISTTGTWPATDIPNLPASKITSGTFAAARIPNLDTSKITTGIMAYARLPISLTQVQAWDALVASGGGPWESGSGSSVHYSAGNVGVGTNSPSETLHVVGTSRFDDDAVFNGETTFDGPVRLSQTQGDISMGNFY